MKSYKKLLTILLLSVFTLSVSGAVYAVGPKANSNSNADNSNKGQSAVTLEFTQTLKYGHRGDAVKLLQTLLATDPSLYSENDITGFFGPKTRAAVKKLQEKNGLESVGHVGPKTRGILNAKLSKVALTEETNEQGQNCVRIPPGHLIAPGWLKKQGNVAPTTPTCQVLPPGIFKKISSGWTGGNSADTVGPKISGIAISGISTTTSTLKFNTNENAVYEIMYGTTTSYGTTSTKTTVFAKSHTFSFTGLTANTNYHYQIKAYDMAGNSTLSADGNFTTVQQDSTGPVISAIAVSAVTHNGATIYWTTNEASTSEVSYGTTNAYGSVSSDLTLMTLHSRVLTGLDSATQYHFKIKSTDGAANVSESSDATFTTLVAPDVTAPVISSIVINAITNSTANVNWSTNESATGKVYWSMTSPVDKILDPSVSTTSGTSHTATVSGLAASTNYYYVIEAKDASLNTSTSTESSFTTIP